MVEGSDYLLSQEALIKFKGLLKEARISKGATFESLSQQTKIPRSHLVALEDGRFDVLPPRVFVKGFLKNLSKELKIDESTLIKSFNLANPETNKNLQFDARKAISTPKRSFVRSIAISSVMDNILMSCRIGFTRSLSKLNFVASGVTQQKVRIFLLLVLLVVGTVPLTRYIASKWSAFTSVKVSDIQLESSKSEATLPSTIGTTADSQVVESQPDLEPNVDEVLGYNPAVTQEVVVPVTSNRSTFEKANPLTNLSKTISPEIQSLKVKVLSPVELQISIDGKREISGFQEAGDFQFAFKSSSDVVVSDGAKIEILFNERSVGSLGEGRRRKLRFQANPSPLDFPH